ncbi:MAG: hypothetical protein IEMM0008_1935 [bacterium]|nr:MAG: hypothetical protein IEMM0008_1935 [bacterium]
MLDAFYLYNAPRTVVLGISPVLSIRQYLYSPSPIMEDLFSVECNNQVIKY